MPIEIPATAIPLQKILTKISTSAEGPIKKRFNIFLAKRNLKHIYDHLRSLGKVRTIWQTDKPAAIRNFYYPQKLSVNDKSYQIKSISDLAQISSHTVVQGIVGQGKSIFMRYLCMEELKKPESIPVFLELRKFTKEHTLIDEIRAYLSDIGLDDSTHTFEHLANNGNLSLLLDAYDELEEEIEKKVYKEIEKFCKKFPNITMIVTSRPNYSIQNSEHFSIANITPLEKSDLEPLLRKLCDDRASADELRKGITGSASSVVELLTTPLMVTLLVFVYKSDRKIPTKPIEFYESLFITVMSRHDKLKPGGVNRNRKTKLSDSNFKKIFNCISFLSSQDSKTSFKESEIIDYIEKAKNYYEEYFESDALLEEVCRITCLILKDGFDYNYLHKSIQEYHAAVFISGLPENKAIEFYSSLVGEGKWHKWREQIQFLIELDKYRCCKYFILPSCDMAEKELLTKARNLKPKVFEKFIRGQRIEYIDDTECPGSLELISIHSGVDKDFRNLYPFSPYQFMPFIFRELEIRRLDLETAKAMVKAKQARKPRKRNELAGASLTTTLGELIAFLNLNQKLKKGMSKIILRVIDENYEMANATIQQLESTEDIFKL